MEKIKVLSLERLIELFEDVPDPRRPGGDIRHKLVDLLVIILLGVISSCETLDTSFHEDESQIYRGYSQENLSVIRKIGQKLLKAETTFKGGSIRRKAKRVAMLNNYAEKILMLGDQL